MKSWNWEGTPVELDPAAPTVPCNFALQHRHCQPPLLTEWPACVSGFSFYDPKGHCRRPATATSGRTGALLNSRPCTKLHPTRCDSNTQSVSEIPAPKRYYYPTPSSPPNSGSCTSGCFNVQTNPRIHPTLSTSTAALQSGSPPGPIWPPSPVPTFSLILQSWHPACTWLVLLPTYSLTSSQSKLLRNMKHNVHTKSHKSCRQGLIKFYKLGTPEGPVLRPRNRPRLVWLSG